MTGYVKPGSKKPEHSIQNAGKLGSRAIDIEVRVAAQNAGWHQLRGKKSAEEKITTAVLSYDIKAESGMVVHPVGCR